MKEEWKDFEECEGYQISNRGRLKRLEKTIMVGDKQRLYREKNYIFRKHVTGTMHYITVMKGKQFCYERVVGKYFKDYQTHEMGLIDSNDKLDKIRQELKDRFKIQADSYKDMQDWECEFYAKELKVEKYEVRNAVLEI